MPQPMPYHLEKGPWIVALETMLNEPDLVAPLLAAAERRDTFRDAVAGFADHGLLDGDPVYDTGARRRWHLGRHWFGDRGDEGRQVPFEDWLADRLGRDRIHPDDVEAAAEELAATGGADRWPRTGFFRQYYGDVEEIVRVTLSRAVQVAYGLAVGAHRLEPTRQLPIEVFWKCGQPWFEGWVTWRLDDDTDGGQVTVVLTTPGTGTPVLEQAASGRRAELDPATTVPSFIDDPGTVRRPSSDVALERRGMWVVTHERNLLLPPLPSTRATARGDWRSVIPDIGPSHAGIGAVHVVRPSFIDGGAPSNEDLDRSRARASPAREVAS